MHHIPAPNPSALRDRAAAHRAMALAALRADSSLSVRLRRYNAAMTKARALEAEAFDAEPLPAAQQAVEDLNMALAATSKATAKRKGVEQ